MLIILESDGRLKHEDVSNTKASSEHFDLNLSYASLTSPGLASDMPVNTLSPSAIEENIKKSINKTKLLESPENLSQKSKEELIKVLTKMTSEISIKNRIIYDLKGKEDWLTAELVSIKAQNTNPSGLEIDRSDILANIFSKADTGKLDPAKFSMLQTLMAFKVELQNAKDKVEQVSLHLLP